LDLPEKVLRNVARMGEAGRAWRADLPRQIGELERRWGISVGPPLPRASEAFVAPARTSDHSDAVLKIVMHGFDPNRQELHILRMAQGIGYAGLIRADEAMNAMLLEKLGPQLHALRLPEDRQIEIVCATLREAWMPAPEGCPFATGVDRAVELARSIESHWTPLARPCAARTVERALSFAEQRRRAFDPKRSVIVHGDAHAWNTLQAPGSATGFKFVDPDGALAEPAFDLAIPMREWGAMPRGGDLVELGRRRCGLLSRFTGSDFEPIWQWALIQCVSNGLSLRQNGLAGPASVQLAMADAWAAAS
jgi:streptomycin 6-kinase